MKKETLNQGQKIMREYIPTFWNSDKYGWMILGVMIDNPNWTRALIAFVEQNETEWLPSRKDVITQTIMHDIGGLMRNDKHFLPRIYQDFNCVILE
tara:strand:+ start:339 stop:626 length:288 start_codon:yes stop_codon:yes gene_type:complete